MLCNFRFEAVHLIKVATTIVVEEMYTPVADVNIWLYLHVQSLVGCSSAINASAMKLLIVVRVSINWRPL